MKPMGPLKMDGNLAENLRKWKQRLNLYAKANGGDSKDEPIQCALFVHTKGEEALEVYDTLTFTLLKLSKIRSIRSFRNLRSAVHQGKILHANNMYLIRAPKTAEHVHSMHFGLTFETKRRLVNLEPCKTA